MAANRRNPIHDASLDADRLLRDIGRELRVARITAGQTQARVARSLGWSQSRVSRAERGRYPSATLTDHSRHAAAVGLRLWVKAYPGVRRVLDAAQLALLGRFRARLHAIWSWELEVPVPLPGDLRAGDCRTAIPGRSVLVEAITRFADAQAQTRSAQRKRRDLRCDRLILLIADTSANRRALAEAGPAFQAAFPVTPRAALRALTAGVDLGGDAIVML